MIAIGRIVALVIRQLFKVSNPDRLIRLEVSGSRSILPARGPSAAARAEAAVVALDNRVYWETLEEQPDGAVVVRPRHPIRKRQLAWSAHWLPSRDCGTGSYQ
jgi:hypothetical protein